MLFGKFVALAAITVMALFGGEVEARHKKRHRGWRKLVHDKCTEDGQANMAIGGEITKDMIKLVKRLQGRGITNLTLVINGRDLVEPHRRKYRSRNRRFLESVAGSAQIAALPWSTKHSLRRMKRRHITRLYSKSASAIASVIGPKPLVVHVAPNDLKRRVVERLHKSGFRLLGNTVYEPTEKNLSRKSFIGLQFAAGTKHFTKFYRHVQGALFNIVSLNECLGSKGIYTMTSKKSRVPKKKHHHRRRRH